MISLGLATILALVALMLGMLLGAAENERRRLRDANDLRDEAAALRRRLWHGPEAL
jgi:hypothetical protein